MLYSCDLTNLVVILQFNLYEQLIKYVTFSQRTLYCILPISNMLNFHKELYIVFFYVALPPFKKDIVTSFG
jgi:hypothetical protein